MKKHLHGIRLFSFAFGKWLFVLAICIVTACGQAPHDPGIARRAALAATDSESPELRLAMKPQKTPQETDDQESPEEPPAGLPGSPAPPLEGGIAWLNTAGPIDLEDLRGKFVVLDFWTYCCINCLHVLPELKKLEKAYPREVVVIGVHSAKFDTEKGSQNIAEAIMRHEIEHPVVNDAEHRIWQRYAVNSWPSIRIIDPLGRLVAGQSGEIPFEAFDAFFKKYLPYYRENGLLDETPLRFDLEAFKAKETPLRYPGKVLADEPEGRLFIADSNHHRIVVTSLEGELQTIIGKGSLGSDDGNFAEATFNQPQGMALLGETLYVADTENHLLRKVNLSEQHVSTIAGTGKQARSAWPGLEDLQESTDPPRYVGVPAETGLNSPWALWVHDDQLYIAMAGPHQIWRMSLDEKEIGPYAGNGLEDIVDGPLLPPFPRQRGYSSFAQPSGLSSDGEWLYVADSEGSSIRAVPFDETKPVRTVVGTAHLPYARLFTFGDEDGDATSARLQHVLGVAYHDGQVYVTDTYNNKIKAVDAETGRVTTIAGASEPGKSDTPPRFDEPAGLSYAAGKLFIADTNNHLIRTVDLRDGYRVNTLSIEGLSAPERSEPVPAVSRELPGTVEYEVPPVTVRASVEHVKFQVEVALPEDYKLNPAAPVSYRLGSLRNSSPNDQNPEAKTGHISAPELPFSFEVPLALAAESESLRLYLEYYYCREGAEGVCKVRSVAWEVPLEITDREDAPDAVTLRDEFQPENFSATIPALQ